MDIPLLIMSFIAGFFVPEYFHKCSEIKRLKKEIVELQQEHLRVLKSVNIYIKRVNEIAENNFSRFSNN